MIKVSGACTLSREPYPFPTSGTRLPAYSMPGVSIAACGARIGRARSPSLNYEQGVEPFLRTDRLSDSERAMLMGGACAKAYGWSPKKG